MADKRTVKKSIKQLQRVKTWQLLILLILVGFIAATFLRLNNIGMAQRRDAVLAADQTGDTEALQNRLYDLQRYVSAHMNADTDGFYLEATYKRALESYYGQAAADSNPNGNIYKKAQEVCAPQYEAWSMAYVQCTKDELDKYPASSDLAVGLQMPRSDGYRHDFAAPTWSPDFAGFTVLVWIFILLIIVVRLLSLLTLRLLLKWQYRNA